MLTKKKHEKSLFWENEKAVFLFFFSVWASDWATPRGVVNPEWMQSFTVPPGLGDTAELQNKENLFKPDLVSNQWNCFSLMFWFCTRLFFLWDHCFLYSILFHCLTKGEAALQTDTDRCSVEIKHLPSVGVPPDTEQTGIKHTPSSVWLPRCTLYSKQEMEAQRSSPETLFPRGKTATSTGMYFFLASQLKGTLHLFSQLCVPEPLF